MIINTKVLPDKIAKIGRIFDINKLQAVENSAMIAHQEILHASALLAKTTQASAELLAKTTQASAELLAEHNEISIKMMKWLTIALVAVGLVQIAIAVITLFITL